MNVVYDLLGFQSRDHGERGIARYVLHLGLALERVRPGLVTQYLMHPDLPFPLGAEPLLATGRVVRADQRSEERSPSAGGVFVAGSPFESFNQPSELVLPSFARTPEWRSIAVIHDVIPALFPDLYLRNIPDRNYYLARLNALSTFDRFLSNSEATTADASEMLGLEPGHVTTIGAGADAQFHPPPNGHEKAAAELAADGEIEGLRPGFILFPTGIDPRKNIERTIQAYGRLPRRRREAHQLVLACRLSEPDRAVVNEMAAEAGLGGELIVTGYVSDPLLCRLYQAAHLVVFPSYYEGFGLPALEAMKCGAPVICADATSLKEVQLLAEARFDPMSVKAIAAALERALTDHDLRQRLRTQEHPPFTWDYAAERAAEVIDELGERLVVRRQEVPRGKPRLALFSPLPPQQTGIATYTHRLLEHLQHLCDVTVFVDPDPDSATELDLTSILAPEGVTVESARNYESIINSGCAFDETLYFIGNSRFHLEALRVLKSYSGSVLFHDVRLTELYREMHRLDRDRLVDGSVGKTVAAHYPGRYRAEVEALDTIGQDEATRFGLLMAREAAEAAGGVFVHSAYAASMLALDCDADPTVVFPLPCPEGKSRFPPPARGLTVASFGVVAPSKQPDKLIAALPFLHKTHPTARLRFVGPVEVHFEKELMEEARALGVVDFVDFTDELEAAAFADAQGEASVAVQMRAFSNGESSAAVTELLALGVPTVVTDLGSMAELPDDAVVKVDVGVDPAVLAQAVAELLSDEDLIARTSEAALVYAEQTSFSAAAETLYETLFIDDETLNEAKMDELLEPIRQKQDETLFYLDMIKNAQSTYLGDYTMLTRLFTGQKIFVDSRDVSVSPALLLEGRWEAETTDAILRLVEPSHCMIDIGANLGYFGMIAGTVIDEAQGGSIHLIEPNPRMVDLMFKSFDASGLMAVTTTSRVAISDKDADQELHIPKDLWGGSFLNSRVREFVIDEVITVPTVTLDNFVKERGIDRVDLIKMDIEGHEDRAYRGMGDVIATNRDHLRMVIEFTTSEYSDPQGFYDQLRDDFKFVYGIEFVTGRLIETNTLSDVTDLHRPDFTLLLTSNTEVSLD